MQKITNWLAVSIICAAVLTASGCTSQSAFPPKSTAQTNGAELKEIRMGIVPLPHYAHIWIAKKKGFIDKELQKVGCKLNWQPFTLGPMVNEAFAAGHLDMGVMGDFPAFIGRSAGIDYQIVAIASAAPKALALIVKKDSEVDKVTNLKGKKVATTKGAYGQKLLAMLLEKNGMTMQDIQFIHMSVDDLSTALLRGDIAAGVIWEPQLTRLEEDGEIRTIADGTNVYEGYAVIMASKDMLANNPQAVEAVLKACQRGKEYLAQHPNEGIKLLMEDIKIPQTEMAKIVNKFNYDGTITDRFVADMKDTEAFMRKNGLLKKPVAIQYFIRKK